MFYVRDNIELKRSTLRYALCTAPTTLSLSPCVEPVSFRAFFCLGPIIIPCTQYSVKRGIHYAVVVAESISWPKGF